jgi:mycofactocin precursor
VPAAGQAREATVTQQAVTALVPEHPAPASEKPAEPGAGRDEALVTGELLVEEISIDGMCGVLTWELTYACNLACVHCLSSSGRRDPAELSTAECKPVPVIIGPRPSPASPPSPAVPPARACDANPLAGFGSEASKDQHYVLDAAHTQRKG